VRHAVTSLSDKVIQPCHSDSGDESCTIHVNDHKPESFVYEVHLSTVDTWYLPQTIQNLNLINEPRPPAGVSRRLFIWGSASFLGASANLRKVTISFVILSVCPLGTTRPPLAGFSLNLIFEYCSKICQENGVFINPLTPNDPHRGRTAPLTSKVAFYIFIQQI
jgi:hypothetical protein